MKEISIENFNENPFTLIGKEWMLITAEKDNKTNMMTASWGGLGVMWSKNVATIYIRPSRYTKTFVDAGEKFSLCVLNENMKDKLSYCGKVSGRDEDKVAKTGLTIAHENNVSYFTESKLVFICKKLYSQKMDKNSLLDEKSLQTFWADDDIHEMYIAEIEKILIAE